MSTTPALPGLGKTLFGDQTPPTTPVDTLYLEGTPKVFKQPDLSVTAALTDPNVAETQGKLKAILVRNASGISLLRKMAVQWATGYERKRIGGYIATGQAAGVAPGEIAGWVDPWLPAGGVSANDLFWLIVEGDILGVTSKATLPGNITAGDLLVAATAAATTHSTTSGRLVGVQNFNVTNDVTNQVILKTTRNAAARALEAKTTDETDDDIKIRVSVPLA